MVQTADVRSGKPRIDGRRITVHDVAIWHEQMGYSVDEIAFQYDLSLAEIYAALTYYFDHKDEVDQQIAESRAFAEEMRRKTPSKLTKKLNERRN